MPGSRRKKDDQFRAKPALQPQGCRQHGKGAKVPLIGVQAASFAEMGHG